jgi:hypothetical protein
MDNFDIDSIDHDSFDGLADELSMDQDAWIAKMLG